MADQPITALRITGDTLNKIMHLDPDVLDMKLKDLWNCYYVLNFPLPASAKRPARVCDIIMSADTFWKKFKFVDGRQPRYNFAAVEEVA